MLGERALEGWRRWNAAWPAPLFHETGVAFLTRAPMQPGGFEHDSYATARRGAATASSASTPPRSRAASRPTGPARYVDGYYHREGGWAESGAVVAQLVAEARARGVLVRDGCAVDRIVDDGALVARPAARVGGGAREPRSPRADSSWSRPARGRRASCPALAPSLRAVGQPVFHLRPADPSPFEAARFPVFGADISRTGYYGFPVTRDGIVKIANHGAGIDLAGGAPRETTPAQERALRELLRETVPGPRRRAARRDPALRLRRLRRRALLDRARPGAAARHRRRRRLGPRLQVRAGARRADRGRGARHRAPARAQVPLAPGARRAVDRRRRPRDVAAPRRPTPGPAGRASDRCAPRPRRSRTAARARPAWAACSGRTAPGTGPAPRATSGTAP